MATKYVADSATAQDDIAEISFSFPSVGDLLIINDATSNGLQVRLDGGDWIIVKAGESLSLSGVDVEKVEHENETDGNNADFRYVLTE